MRTFAPSLASVFLFAAASAAEEGPRFTLSGPYTHENLTVFLFHSAPSAGTYGDKLLPLKQAMEQKKVVVYETGQVNELAIENKSSHAVFVQGGDIVKGGQQDRVFTMDMILPAQSGRVPIAAFCVERGRWTKRGAEDARTFSASNMSLASRESKIAVKGRKDQQEVWASVDNARAVMSLSAGSVAHTASTSMQLALEAPGVEKSVEPYHRALAKIIDAHPDATGCAFTINGEINSADLYSSPALFRQLWPKLLNSISIEASTARTAGKTFTPVDAAAVESALREAQQGNTSTKPVNGQTRLTTRESAKWLLFESQDSSTGWIHRNYIAK